MKTKTYLIAFFAFFMPYAIYAQTAGETNHDATAVEENPEVKRKIENLVHELYESIKNKDLERQKEFHLYSDDFTAFYGGQLRKDAEGAQEYEENLVRNIPENIDFDIQDLRVSVYENVAVASFHIYVTSNVEGVKKQSQAGLSLVYLNVDGAWKIVHEHVSPLTEARPE